MSLLRFPVTVVVECVPLVNRWVTEQWRVAGVEPVGEFAVAVSAHSMDPVPVATAIAHDKDASPPSRRWCITGLYAELHTSEAQGYYLNITAPAPKIFVMCRYTECDDENDLPKLRPRLVTVSYDEAARFMDGGEQVEAAPLPPSMLDWMRPFVVAHYRPEPPRKVRRNELYERDGAASANPRKPVA